MQRGERGVSRHCQESFEREQVREVRDVEWQAGGELKVFASTYVGDHIGDNDPRDCIRYEAGAKGVVLGNVECRKRLTILTDPDAKVRVGVNGARKER